MGKENKYADIEIRPANEWMREAGSRPMPDTLFGEMWFEGELAVLFGDTGAGKSILATQIGESIARGYSFEPIENTALPQKVLYVDMNLSSKQFEIRYCAGSEMADGELADEPYIFSDDLRRVELRADMLPGGKDGEFGAELRQMLKSLVQRAEAKVLIIDSISHLKRTADDGRGLNEILKELKRLKDECGISILVVANMMKRSQRRPITAGDVQGARAVADHADNIFAVGTCRTHPSFRYIKHVRPRNTEVIYDETHVPIFQIKKGDDSFLGFGFRGFAAEADLLRDPCNAPHWMTVEKVQAMSGSGMSIRQIAAELDMSKSNVHRYLHTKIVKREEQKLEVKQKWNDFPGCEEYEARANDPRFDDIDSRDDAEAHALMREAYLIDVATANARTEYVKNGNAPKFDEAWTKLQKELIEKYGSTGLEILERGEGAAHADEPLPAGKDTSPAASADDDVFSPSVIAAPDPEKEAARRFETTARLRRTKDPYGQEIFIETEDEQTGKPIVWYRTDTRNNRFKYVRNDVAVSRHLMKEEQPAEAAA